MCNEISGWFIRHGETITPRMREAGMIEVRADDGVVLGQMMLAPHLTNSHTELAGIFGIDEDNPGCARFEFQPRNTVFYSPNTRDGWTFRDQATFTDALFDIDKNWSFRWDNDASYTNYGWVTGCTEAVTAAIRGWVKARTYDDRARVMPHPDRIARWMMVRDHRRLGNLSRCRIFHAHNTTFYDTHACTFVRSNVSPGAPAICIENSAPCTRLMDACDQTTIWQGSIYNTGEDTYFNNLPKPVPAETAAALA